MPRDAHHHRREAAGIAAQIDDDAVGLPELVDRRLELGVDGRHPHVEADDADGSARRRLLLRGLDPHEHRRQVPHRDRLAGFRVPFERKRDRRSAAVLECDVDARSRWTAQMRLGHPPRLDVQQPAVVSRRLCRSGLDRGARVIGLGRGVGAPRQCTKQIGDCRVANLHHPPAGFDLAHVAIDRVTSRLSSASRTSNPGSPLRSSLAPGASAEAGTRAK